MGLTASLPKKTQPDFFGEGDTNDLAGLEFCDNNESQESEDQEKKIEVSTAKQLAEKEYPKLPFEGYYKALLAEPASDFWMMIYGLPFQGKTTFSIGFAKYLAENMGNVLYVSAEQYDSEGLRQVIRNVDAEGLSASLQFSPSLEKAPPLNQFDFIFIDSGNAAKLTIDHMKWYRNNYKGKSFITILQSTKEGDFRGNQDWRHFPGIVVRIEDRQAHVEKNQFITGEAVVLPLPELNVKGNRELSGLDGSKSKEKSILIGALYSTTIIGIAKMIGETKSSMQRVVKDTPNKIAGRLLPVLEKAVKKTGARVRIENFEFADIDTADNIKGIAFFSLQLRGRSSEIEKVGDDYGGKLFIVTEDDDWDEEKPEREKGLFGKDETITVELDTEIQEFVELYNLLEKGESMDDVIDIFENQTERVNSIVHKETVEEMKRQKAKVKVKSVKWAHNAPEGSTFGTATFRIELEGTRKELEKVADVDQIFFYEWNNHE